MQHKKELLFIKTRTLLALFQLSLYERIIYKPECSVTTPHIPYLAIIHSSDHTSLSSLNQPDHAPLSSTSIASPLIPVQRCLYYPKQQLASKSVDFLASNMQLKGV
jgi:hypothetical protein